MVLSGGINNVKQLMAGDAAGSKISQIVVGTSAAPVTGNEITLTNPVAKTISTVNYLAGGYIQFNSQLDASDPAMNIAEIGLLNAAGVLCYRQVITPVNKVAGVVYSLAYKIKVQ